MRQVLGMLRYIAYECRSAPCVARNEHRTVVEACRTSASAAASRHNVLMYARRQMADRLAGGPRSRPAQ